MGKNDSEDRSLSQYYRDMMVGLWISAFDLPCFIGRGDQICSTISTTLGYEMNFLSSFQRANDSSIFPLSRNQGRIHGQNQSRTVGQGRELAFSHYMIVTTRAWRTDGWTDGRTKPLIESLVREKKEKKNNFRAKVWSSSTVMLGNNLVWFDCLICF